MDPEAAATEPSLHAVWLQKSMDAYGVPWIIQLFLCWVYDRYGFAANARSADGTWLNIEEYAVFDDPVDAYWAANQVGKGVIGMTVPVPHNRLGTVETVSYGSLACPQSAHQHIYRHNRKLDVPVSRDAIDRLQEKVDHADNFLEQFRRA